MPYQHSVRSACRPKRTRAAGCTLEEVRTEMSPHVLAYNVKRVIAILGAGPLMQAIRA